MVGKGYYRQKITHPENSFTVLKEGTSELPAVSVNKY
jgi:hypothetical protein